MCLILDGYVVMDAQNLQWKLTIIENKWNEIINMHNN
jgi:hypothetical protein